MSSVEDFITILHTDPETLPGVPTDEEIIESSPDNLKRWKVTEISAGERAGFLEMWRLKYVRREIADLEDPDLETLHKDVHGEFYDPEVLARKFDDLRFILIAAGQSIAARRMQNKEN